jgi:hypothetical protein
VNPNLTQNSYFWKSGDFTSKLKISPAKHQRKTLIHRRRDSGAIFGLNTNLFFNKDTQHRNSMLIASEPEGLGGMLGLDDSKNYSFPRKSVFAGPGPGSGPGHGTVSGYNAVCPREKMKDIKAITNIDDWVKKRKEVQLRKSDSNEPMGRPLGKSIRSNKVGSEGITGASGSQLTPN